MAAENTALPRAVAWLGYGGLIPFLVLAPASLIDQHHGAVWSDALYAYGAIILSFVGALHWGLAMSLPELSERQRSAWFAWSVVPALIAWPALLFSPPLAAPLLVVGFIAQELHAVVVAGGQPEIEVLPRHPAPPSRCRSCS